MSLTPTAVASKVGTVDSIYTYGAPGVASSPLENLLSEDRCFNGLRSYNEDVLGPATKQVDAAAMSNLLAHSKMPTAILHLHADSLYVAGEGRPTWPNNFVGDTFQEWRLHWEGDYTPRLWNISVHGQDFQTREPFRTAHEYVLFAYKSYDSLAHTVRELGTKRLGWHVVARETRVEGAGASYDEDPVMVLQHATTLECALVFAGTNNANELGTSIHQWGRSYCGFDNVHAGYQNELRRITGDLWPRLRPKLSRCRKVACVGHSMGGSLCELFAACANSQRLEDADYQQQAWTVGAPVAMETVTRGRTFYAEGAERRCEEPPCWKV